MVISQKRNNLCGLKANFGIIWYYLLLLFYSELHLSTVWPNLSEELVVDRDHTHT